MSTETEETVCSSCAKQKDELTVTKSQLFKSMRLYMCKTCIEAKFEPRYLVMLYGHQNGRDSVLGYLEAKRYYGEEILAKDL